MDQFLVGLHGWQRQELSIDQVPESFLEQALGNLEMHISSEHPAFSIAEPEAVYYYKYGKPAYSLNNSPLTIYLNIHLKSSDTAFRLYTVSDYAIPAVSNDSLYTRLVPENNVFGISHDWVNFLGMKREELESSLYQLAKTSQFFMPKHHKNTQVPHLINYLTIIHTISEKGYVCYSQRSDNPPTNKHKS